MARVLIEEEGQPTRSFRLQTDAVSIGRSDAVDLVLPDAAVSRKHALFLREGDGWAIEDQKSANGITINGVQAERAALAQNDVVIIGKFRITFQNDDEGDQAEYTDPSVGGRNEQTIPGIAVAEIQAAQANLAAASLPPPSPHLVGTDGERYDLSGDSLRFGQDIPVSGVIPFGSPGQIQSKDGGWTVKKGFFLTPIEVNGKTVSAARLKQGDVVRIGSSRFTYHGP